MQLLYLFSVAMFALFVTISEELTAKICMTLTFRIYLGHMSIERPYATLYLLAIAKFAISVTF